MFQLTPVTISMH